ncbi:hypothetical protein TTHERM_000707502 (macronuclear) [Tetrahymena thermophila SB210]|uniref:Uncharacterized protein n=1 Tax=Tetrahymena thermophila (strain SB210) TaxID=312017 RepID=W7XDN5_TETTS|nr:hypothetical protein TTHERM_000707502 [Tetrahymena thermophila SB210]EWS75697.1 hypothetical protein TTHERM_000707502 [Tetrahymena thermophila SB210]|eukprot:XP_012651770.1 hypothetical protein TTHERM_000707502 [Tetrahymena thermophila SB210]
MKKKFIQSFLKFKQSPYFLYNYPFRTTNRLKLQEDKKKLFKKLIRISKQKQIVTFVKIKIIKAKIKKFRGYNLQPLKLQIDG